MSYFATPGAEAFGFLGEVPADIDAYGGMTMAEYAILPCGRLLEPLTFTFSEYTNGKWGGAPEVQAFFVLAILYSDEQTDAPIVRGVWASDHDGDSTAR